MNVKELNRKIDKIIDEYMDEWDNTKLEKKDIIVMLIIFLCLILDYH